MRIRGAVLCGVMIAVAGCAGGSGKPAAGKPTVEKPASPAVEPSAPAPDASPTPSPSEAGAPAAPAAAKPPATGEPVAPASTGADPAWWIASAVRDGGRLRVAAKADAETMIDARRLAVRAGTESLKAELKADPTDVQTEKADLAHLDDGRWRVFVLMSCKE